MTHRNIVAIDCIGGGVLQLLRCQVGDNLVTMKIEIDPLIGTASFGTTQQVAIELACSDKIINRESEGNGA